MTTRRVTTGKQFFAEYQIYTEKEKKLGKVFAGFFLRKWALLLKSLSIISGLCIA
jgi:hypothetical protein